jgi:hypothetical protein
VTLKEFAAQQGIGYNLAKQWKARGKIVTDGDGYRLVTSESVTKPGVTKQAVTGDTVTAVTRPRVLARQPAGNRTLPESPAESCAGCAALADRVETNTREIASLRLALASLDGDYRTLRDRCADLEAAQPGNVASDVVESLFGPRSNFTGTASALGERFDD